MISYFVLAVYFVTFYFSLSFSPSISIFRCRYKMNGCNRLYYAVRSWCIPLEEDIRYICEENGSVDQLRIILEQYPRLDLSKTRFQLPKRAGYTPLTLAARCGHMDIVRFLVEEERVPIDDCDFKWFGSALHHACRKNQLAIAAYLIKEGSDVNMETIDSNYYTPLHWAASRGHVEAADLLLKHGAQLDVEDKNGSTALHWACFHGREQMIRLLLSRGASKARRNYLGMTPLGMYNSRFGNRDIAALLQVKEATDAYKALPIYSQAEETKAASGADSSATSAEDFSLASSSLPLPAPISALRNPIFDGEE